MTPFNNFTINLFTMHQLLRHNHSCCGIYTFTAWEGS